MPNGLPLSAAPGEQVVSMKPTSNRRNSNERRVLSGGRIAGGPAVSGTLCFGTTSPDEDALPPDPGRVEDGAASELARVDDEMAAVIREIRDMSQMLRSEGYHAESDILSTHLLMLRDDGLRTKVRSRIENHEVRAEEAAVQVFGELKERLRRSGNAMTSARTADVEDLMQRLQRRLSQQQSGQVLAEARIVSDPIMVLPELLVSQIVAARDAGVRAVVVEYGTPLSHAAIIAKAFSIPILRISGISNLRPDVGAAVVVDADNGRLVVHPEPADLPDTDTSLLSEPELVHGPSLVRIWLNVMDAGRPEAYGPVEVEGIGLYRSEFLLNERTDRFPSEDEQLEVYRRLCLRWDGHPVTLRTFDIGGDKVLPYFSLGSQQNPYLGLRAHRLYRFHPELFLTQIRAILRAAVGRVRLRILYPMVETLDDLIFLQGLVAQATEQLDQEGVLFQRNFEQGVMIEVPSAVWALPELLDRCDFASVGTNDLLQYHFAVDRGNPNVSSRCRPEHPSALRMLKHIADVAASAGTRVTLCGEAAADPRMTPLILGLRFRDVSVDANAVRVVSQASGWGSFESFRKLADRCLGAGTLEEVHGYLHEFDGWNPGQSLGADLEASDPSDLVCGMTVVRNGNPYIFAHNDETYNFCSEQCMAAFAGHPELYEPAARSASSGRLGRR